MSGVLSAGLVGGTGRLAIAWLVCLFLAAFSRHSQDMLLQMRREGELDMRRISRMILVTAGYNFRMWKKICVIAAFLLAFILCFMLTDKLVLFAGNRRQTLCSWWDVYMDVW